MDLLGHYRELVASVDTLCAAVTASFSSSISCRRGCVECCRELGLFPVEAYALSEELNRLPEEARAEVRRYAAATTEGCPLLHDGACLLYEARPLICRTHGYPLIVTEEGSRRVDFCPRNFRGVQSLPGNLVLDLEKLNLALAAVNARFLAAASPLFDGDRVPIKEALLGRR